MLSSQIRRTRDRLRTDASAAEESGPVDMEQLRQVEEGVAVCGRCGRLSDPHRIDLRSKIMYFQYATTQVGEHAELRGASEEERGGGGAEGEGDGGQEEEVRFARDAQGGRGKGERTRG